MWNWLREPNSNRNLRAHGLGGATQKPDGKRPAALRKLSARNTTSARHGSCRRTIRPAAIRKLSAHNTTGALYGSCRRAIRPAEPTRTAPRAAALQVEPAKTAPRAAALQGGQRCLRSRCALGAASGVDAASAPEQVLARRKVGAQYERRSAEEFEDGQNRADRTDAEIAISGVKGGGAIRILQSEGL